MTDTDLMNAIESVDVHLDDLGHSYAKRSRRGGWVWYDWTGWAPGNSRHHGWTEGASLRECLDNLVRTKSSRPDGGR